MFAKELIYKPIPFLYEHSSGKEGKDLMEKFKLHHLPVLGRNGKYKCLISDEEILLMEDMDAPIQGNDIFCPSVYEKSLWTDVLDKAAQFKLSVVPVISENNLYSGSIPLELLVEKLALLLNTGEEGSILILEANPEEEGLSRISAIVEANKARILFFFTTYESTTQKNLLYLKINLEDASAIIQGLERGNYKVLFYFMKNTGVDHIFQERINEFIHYLDI